MGGGGSASRKVGLGGSASRGVCLGDLHPGGSVSGGLPNPRSAYGEGLGRLPCEQNDTQV